MNLYFIKRSYTYRAVNTLYPCYKSKSISVNIYCFSVYHTKPINVFCGENVEFFNAKSDAI